MEINLELEWKSRFGETMKLITFSKVHFLLISTSLFPSLFKSHLFQRQPDLRNHNLLEVVISYIFILFFHSPWIIFSFIYMFWNLVGFSRGSTVAFSISPWTRTFQKIHEFSLFLRGESKSFPKGNEASSAGLGRFLRIPGALQDVYKDFYKDY